MITLLATSVYLLLKTEEPMEILPAIIQKQENVPLLVKPNRVYKTEVSPWDKMFARVKHYESFKSEAYRCSGGVMTIGYGHTKNVKWGDTITETEALKLLEEEKMRGRGRGGGLSCVELGLGRTRRRMDMRTDMAHILSHDIAWRKEREMLLF